MVIDVTGIGATDDELANIFSNYINGTKSTVTAMRLKSVGRQMKRKHLPLMVAKDEEGIFMIFRSLLNGTK